MANNSRGFVSQSGSFERDENYITTRITADGRDGYPVEAGRYRLIVSRACPWANRAIIVRRLLGLEDALSMGVCRDRRGRGSRVPRRQQRRLSRRVRRIPRGVRRSVPPTVRASRLALRPAD